MSKSIWFILFTVSFMCHVTSANATPKEIMIIRHTDKLIQDEPGPALSAPGLARSISFAFYFLKRFGEPDFIIAADDEKITGKEIAIRSIQTVAPLANLLQERHPNQPYPILHPYPSDNFQQLADDLLKQPMFNGKRVLICWSHQRIAKLTAALGVTDNIPDWPRPDYDTVYDLQFQSGLNKIAFTVLRNQFPVNTHLTWDMLNKSINGSKSS